MDKDNPIFYIKIDMGTKAKSKPSGEYNHYKSSGLAYISTTHMTQEQFEAAKVKIEAVIKEHFTNGK